MRTEELVERDMINISALVIDKNLKQKRYENIDTSEDLLTFLKQKRAEIVIKFEDVYSEVNNLRKKIYEEGMTIDIYEKIKSLTKEINEKCFYNKSKSDKFGEVFTPFEIIEFMLNCLPKETWTNPNLKIIDPCGGLGNFFIVMLPRFMHGLKEAIPNNEERLRHIVCNMFYYCEIQESSANLYERFFKSLLGDEDAKLNIYIGSFLESKVDKGIIKLTNKLHKDFVAKMQEWGVEHFDLSATNPPYQDSRENTSDTPIYHLFMDTIYKMCDKGLFITPGRFLFNAGKSPNAWNKKMLNDESLKVVKYYRNSNDVFPDISLKGGVAITLRDEYSNYGSIKTFTENDVIKSILNKVWNNDFKSIKDIIYSSDSYKFSNKLHIDYPTAESLLSKGHKYSITTNIFEKLNHIFKNEETMPNMVKFHGRLKFKRCEFFIDNSYIKEHDNLNSFKVFLPKSNGSGDYGKIGESIIAKPNEGHTQTYMSIGKFDNYTKVENLSKYLKTKFLRFLLGTLKVTQHNSTETWSNVPMLDFSDSSVINWTEDLDSIDEQLFNMYNLSDDEINFIKELIK